MTRTQKLHGEASASWSPLKLLINWWFASIKKGDALEQITPVMPISDVLELHLWCLSDTTTTRPSKILENKRHVQAKYCESTTLKPHISWSIKNRGRLESVFHWICRNRPSSRCLFTSSFPSQAQTSKQGLPSDNFKGLYEVIHDHTREYWIR